MVDLAIGELVSYFRIYKLNEEYDKDNLTEEHKYDAELVVTGHLDWDGCSNLSYGDGGLIHFCETDDLICMNKCIEFVWRRVEEYYSDYVEYWDVNCTEAVEFEGGIRL